MIRCHHEQHSCRCEKSVKNIQQAGECNPVADALFLSVWVVWTTRTLPLLSAFHAINVFEQHYGISRNLTHRAHETSIIEFREVEAIHRQSKVCRQGGNQRCFAGSWRPMQQVATMVRHAKSRVPLLGTPETRDIC